MDATEVDISRVEVIVERERDEPNYGGAEVDDQNMRSYTQIPRPSRQSQWLAWWVNVFLANKVRRSLYIIGSVCHNEERRQRKKMDNRENQRNQERNSLG